MTDCGATEVTARGVCWSTSASPETSDENTIDSSGIGEFTSTLTELIPSTPYYVIAYATNIEGTAYGSTLSFTTLGEGDTLVTDIDGNVYETVTIGTQIWMAENLKVTHYRNCDQIPNVTYDNDWFNLSTGACCEFDNDPSNVATYGRLYNYYVVDDPRGLAPAGWHVPNDDEWKTLEVYLGMSPAEADSYGWRGTNEGSKLAGRADLWYDGDLEEDPEFGTSGFTALPGGYRYFPGTFTDLTCSANFWSSSEFSSYTAWDRCLTSNKLGISRHYDLNKRFGFSVRCVRD
ncbi:fibrobacter succinogenes major paralogous domain-containing protein [bacterium]|nr:fibrobacter succinogenes major paralogous domain-containing protein [bacterium]